MKYQQDLKPELMPKYPYYIISKGRADSRYTSRTFEEIGLPYHIVIEPQEYEAYAAVIDPKKIITTDFSNLGQGSIPVRNFVWEHAKAAGHKGYWICDDNIRNLYRLYKNTKIAVTTPYMLRSAEDFIDRYPNVKMAGLNYAFFAPAHSRRPPYYLNTRCYSFIWLPTDLDLRWRVSPTGPYNEDTDLSIRIMKEGHCTILFNHLLCGKTTTQVMKGGNTEEVYKVGSEENDKRKKFAEGLVQQHPDVVSLTYKWGRWHHNVDYTAFRQKLELDPELVGKIPKGTNEYGMKLKRIPDEKTL
jgi:hypothetical protein